MTTPFIKKTAFALLACWPLLLVSCGDRNQNVNMTVTSEAADGLDLKAVTALLKTVDSPAKLEEKINGNSPRICNLDLNEDDVIDYVKVTEYANGNVKGFSLTTELAEGDIQELATIEITTDSNGNHSAQTHGNSTIYGDHYYHHYRGPGIGDYLLISYLMRPHTPYYSSYGYNRYPSNYSRSRPLDNSTYRSGLSGVDSKNVTSSKTPAFKGSDASPNKARTSNRIKAPLRKPTASQKAFQSRNPSRAIRSGGFGSSRSGSSSSSMRSSSRSGSSFGGGK
ncbi:hypothetical protein V2O64_09880 [Verrucomicrobiaceae bacterium 227]